MAIANIAAERTIEPRPSIALADTPQIPAGCELEYASIDCVLPRGDAGGWLTDRERQVVARLRDERRRRAWLAGRIALKRLLIERLERAGCNELMRPDEVEIVSRNAAGRAVRPVAALAGQRLDWPLSIAHTDRHVLVAVASEGTTIGVDLVDARFAPGRGFRRMWFTPAEQAWLRAAGSPAAALWAAKEAIYKATNGGEPFLPRRIEVDWQRAVDLVLRGTSPAADCCQLTTWLTAGGEIAALATCDEIATQPGDCTHD